MRKRIATQFHSSDSWILLAIAYSSREAVVGLPEIIAVADAINHAIPTTQEMDGALNRLLAARLITSERGAFTVTKTGRAAITKAEKRSKQVPALWENLHTLLCCPCCGPRLHSVRRRVQISDEAMKKAYEARGRYWERIRRRHDP